MKGTRVTYTSIRPGQVWLDTNGNRIQAHGGSIFHADGVFYWYGEDKERTEHDNGIWHWGVRAYRSTDLYNWEDLGSIIPVNEDDPEHPLHFAQLCDRPHIIYNERTKKFVCWIKIMHRDQSQSSTVLTADEFTGPYEIVASGIQPMGMNAGDFDLVVEPTDGKAYYYFERVHSELIVADLTPDYTNVTGYYSTHMPHPHPPTVREAPAHFRRGHKHYLFTSGTTGYFPNASEVAIADSYHGPWTVLGDPHIDDTTRTSHGSQICSVFKHPHKKDLYIALADRWLPHFDPQYVDAVAASFDRYFTTQPEDFGDLETGIPPEVSTEHTATADYVWLPVRFEGEMAYLDWHDEWRIEDYE